MVTTRSEHAPRRPHGGVSPREGLVWYVAYGSNLRLERLRHYLAGGRPPGARAGHRGGRDPADPLDVRSLHLPGGIRFAGASRVWGGGVAFYDPLAEGSVAARGYLLTRDQLNDLVTQETRQAHGADLGLHRVSPGRPTRLTAPTYDTVLHVGTTAGLPMLTITTGHALGTTAPVAAYVWSVARGLAQAFSWSPSAIATYLMAAPGVSHAFTHSQVAALATAPEPTSPGLTP